MSRTTEGRAADSSVARIAARFTWMVVSAGVAYYIILFALAY